MVEQEGKLFLTENKYPCWASNPIHFFPSEKNYPSKVKEKKDFLRQKLRKFVASRPGLQKMLTKIL